MKVIMHGSILLLLLAAIWLGLWLFHPVESSNSESLSQTVPAEDKAAAAPEPASPPTKRSRLADGLNDPSKRVEDDLEIVRGLFNHFRTVYGANPVGNNRAMVRALSGKNARNLAFLPPDHPTINEGGELADRWGIPYFFHQESATRVEIRSAGPDKRLWTEDDQCMQHDGQVRRGK